MAYDQSVLSPTAEDLVSMEKTDTNIPLPASGSIKFDHLRRRLWWLSKAEESIAYMANVTDMSFRSISVSDFLDSSTSLAIDKKSGNAIVGGSYSGLGTVTVVNSSCSGIVESLTVSGSRQVNDLVIEGAELGNVMPFYCSVLANPSAFPDSSSSSSNSSVEIEVDHIENAILAEQEAPLVTTSSPIVTVRIWGQDRLGTASTRSWAIKGGSSGQTSAELSISMPKFSWTTNVISGTPTMAIVDGFGNLLKATYDLSLKVFSVSEKCSVPVGVPAMGVSTTNGSGNVYVSGDGIVAKICFDPPTPGIAIATTAVDSSSSSSSWSSQSGHKTENYPILVVSEMTGDTGIEGLSVQFHDKSETVWAVSGRSGLLVSFDGASGLRTTGEYGPLPMPFKAIWSGIHSGAVVACKNAVNVVSIPSGDKKTAYATPGYEVTDICLSDGKIGIAMSSANHGDGLFKILAPNLSTNLLTYRTGGEFPSKSVFSPTGKAVVAVERTVNGNQVTRFVSMGIGEPPGTASQDMLGTVCSMFSDENFGMVFAAFSSGEIVIVSQDSSGGSVATKIGAVLGGISVASGSLVSGISTTVPSQTAVRVFVGSAEGSSDRWDSGEVETTSQSMTYGGGDNLVPGEAYWLSVSVKDLVGGWSTPTSRQFVVPLM